MNKPLLSATRLVKQFGGLTAVNDVSIDLWGHRIHGVIGPNGAGKSTLTNLLSGDLPLTSGAITLGGVDVTSSSPEQISRRGLGRSYQKTNVFLPFTVWENVRLAAQSREPQRPWSPLHWLGSASAAGAGSVFRRVQQRADEAIELAGLAQRRDEVAGILSHGEQRQLEIAMVLATQPRVLLLDEPLAGMGTVEADSMIDLLSRLKQQYAILLVEHDMEAVFALADHLTVMVNGEVIASDTPSVVRADAKVQAAYLGEES